MQLVGLNKETLREIKNIVEDLFNVIADILLQFNVRWSFLCMADKSQSV